MSLPNLSYMVSVGELRYIQSRYEVPECRNPDVLVGHLLPRLQRWVCDVRGRVLLNRLRSQPFYYYLLARTKYYDAVFLDGIRDKASVIVNIGCGTDTRAYRFREKLKANAIKVLECDQLDAIRAKEQLVRRHWAVDHVEYLSLDLDSDSGMDGLRGWLRKNAGAKTLVLMEGVAPYLRESAVRGLLQELRDSLCPGSHVAYDFKRLEVGREFGRTDGAAFRLPIAEEAVRNFHDGCGYRVNHMESSAALSVRLVPHLAASRGMVFEEDCLLRLETAGIPERVVSCS